VLQSGITIGQVHTHIQFQIISIDDTIYTIYYYTSYNLFTHTVLIKVLHHINKILSYLIYKRTVIGETSSADLLENLLCMRRVGLPRTRLINDGNTQLIWLAIGPWNLLSALSSHSHLLPSTNLHLQNPWTAFWPPEILLQIQQWFTLIRLVHQHLVMQHSGKNNALST